MSFLNILSKIFGTRNDRLIKSYQKIVNQINLLEEGTSTLTDEQIKNKRTELIQKINEGSSLASLMPEAFAIVREASKRSLKMRHFDVQLIGGIVLCDGKIAEMKTGEGKTLVASLAVYLNSLVGTVHLVTANDYLAKRDEATLKPLYEALGLSSASITSKTTAEERRLAYAANVTYTTNNELGFDYLRDNMKMQKEDMCLINKPLSFAIVDEIDSILIDEARTPLIISGIADSVINFYKEASYIVNRLTTEAYEIDEKSKGIHLTDAGYTEVENILVKMNILKEGETLFGTSSYAESILQPEVYARNGKIIQMINSALRAEKILTKDTDYIIKDGKALIIDEFTGRISEGRRYGGGIHQAIEAKHGLKIEPETQTVASITYQNYFRLYKKLAGMTGTAQTEADEFREIYKLDVISIPTNRPINRKDEDDVIYKTEAEKFEAIANFVEDLNKKGQPVLVGTVSINKSELLSSYFKKKGLKHSVLNAKIHEKEAEIIADAGRKGAITIATNMAGRGTDIILGGNLEKKLHTATEEEKNKIIEQHKEEQQAVKEAGGLFILASERHESRRIDNQLRGRSGRQGDVGSSKFFLSLQDDLLRIFGGKMLETMLGKLGFKEGEAINHPWLNGIIERAQKKVEGHNFEVRKNLLKYDDMLNEQRQIIYSKRLSIVLQTMLITDEMEDIITEEIEGLFTTLEAMQKESEDANFEETIRKMFNINNAIKLEGSLPDLKEKTMIIVNQMYATLAAKEGFEERQKYIILSSLDHSWKEHLYNVDSIRNKISLRSYAQKDPLNEYKLELFKAFEEMMLNYRKLIILNTFK